jgi:hypothetical protein
VQGCIEAIKAVFYTLAAVSEGHTASCPIPNEDVEIIKACVSELAKQLIARMQKLTQEAHILLSEGSDNPLRGLRYMLNCIWKLYDLPDFAPLVCPACLDIKTKVAIFGMCICITHERIV